MGGKVITRRDDDIEAAFTERTALAVREPAGLFRTDDPVEVITKATRIADALKAVVVSKKLVTNIQGKEYPQVEAWLTLASMMNLRPVIEWSRPVEGGWEARCSVRNAHSEEIGAGEAQCTREEKMWAKRDDYALRSMAQTRATSKSLRSVLGFIMTLAGYAPTPAEEMPPANDARKPAKADGEVITTTRIMDLWRAKGEPNGSVQAWMRVCVAGYTSGQPTAAQRKEAWDKLSALDDLPVSAEAEEPALVHRYALLDEAEEAARAADERDPRGAQKAMFALCNERGITEQKRKQILIERYAQVSSNDLTVAQMSDLIDFIKAHPLKAATA